MSSSVERYTGTFTATKDKNGEVVLDPSTVTLNLIGENGVPIQNGTPNNGTANSGVGNGVVGNDAVNPTTNSIGQGAADSTNSSAVITNLINQFDTAVNAVKSVADNPANAVSAGQNGLSYVVTILGTLNELFQKIPKIKTAFQGTISAVQTLKKTWEECKGKIEGTFDKTKNMVSSNTTISQKIEGFGDVISSGRQTIECSTSIQNAGIGLYNAWKADKLNWDNSNSKMGGRNRRRKRSQMKRSRIKKTNRKSRIKKTYRRRKSKRAHNIRTH